jgi:hypothetical protein
VAADKVISVIGMQFTQKTHPTPLFLYHLFINSSAGDSATPIICGRQNQD